MVFAVVHMAPLTMPSASPQRTIMVPAVGGQEGMGVWGRMRAWLGSHKISSAALHPTPYPRHSTHHPTTAPNMLRSASMSSAASRDSALALRASTSSSAYRCSWGQSCSSRSSGSNKAAG